MGRGVKAMKICIQFIHYGIYCILRYLLYAHALEVGVSVLCWSGDKK